MARSRARLTRGARLRHSLPSPARASTRICASSEAPPARRNRPPGGQRPRRFGASPPDGAKRRRTPSCEVPVAKLLTPVGAAVTVAPCADHVLPPWLRRSRYRFWQRVAEALASAVNPRHGLQPIPRRTQLPRHRRIRQVRARAKRYPRRRSPASRSLGWQPKRSSGLWLTAGRHRTPATMKLAQKGQCRSS